MEVRCPGCRKAVSEWAARCPSCQTDLAGAEPIGGPPPPPEGPIHWPGRRIGRRRRRIGSATIVVTLIAIVAIRSVHGSHLPPRGAVTSGLSKIGAGAQSDRSGLGAGAAARLRSQRLFVADGRTTEALLTDGTVLHLAAPRHLAESATGEGGEGTTPVLVGADTVAYIVRGMAYAFDEDPYPSTTPLGAASQIYSAGVGMVDLVGMSGGRRTVRPTSLTGRSAGTPSALPVADQVAGVSDLGLIVETADGDLHLVYGRRTKVVTGPVRRVVAVSGGDIAWTSIAGCTLALTGDCPLHLTDLATGTNRSVASTGLLGFSGVGAFSPDGQFLAVYSLPAGRQAAARLDLSIVEVSTGTTRRLGSVLETGLVAPTVTWSPDGEWIFFGGAGSFDALDFAPPHPASPLRRAVPLPVSATCCVVGF